MFYDEKKDAVNLDNVDDKTTLGELKDKISAATGKRIVSLSITGLPEKK